MGGSFMRATQNMDYAPPLQLPLQDEEAEDGAGLVTQAPSSATTLCPAISSQPHRASGRRPRMVAVRPEADDKALEVAGTEEASAPVKSKGLGFGSSASKAPKGGKKKGSRERGSVIRRTPIGNQALLSPSRDSEAEKQSGNEGAFLLTWLGLGILIFVEGIVLASSVYRDRERKVARYNKFRRNLLMAPISRREDLTDDKEAIATLREVYSDDVEKLDLLVGLQAEMKIKEFAISETVFFIFLLIASRRLEADRFFTTNCNSNIYTERDLEWINKTETLKDVIDRRFPQMTKRWMKCSSAFSVWSSMPDRKTLIQLYHYTCGWLNE